MSERPSLKQVLASIEKDCEVAVRKLSDIPIIDILAVSSGSYLLNDALGVGGYPRGRIIEIFGAPSGGKSSISLMAVAEAQKAGGIAAFIDVEHCFSKAYATSLGVDVDNLYFVQPDFGEQALEILERLTSTNEFDIIVLDSTAALVPKAEAEAEMVKESMALQARMMSKALRKLTPIIGKTKTVVIFINQTRQNVAVMYGNPLSTPGGEALKFYSSVRLNVRKIGGSDIKEGDVVKGHHINITCVKNKVGPPSRSAELTFRFEGGIDKTLDLIEYALNKGALDLKGHTYSFGDQKWVGRDNAIEAIKSDLVLQASITQWVKDKQSEGNK